VTRLSRLCAAGTIAVLVLRAIAMIRFPLSGDEAYYWEWSRRLAIGYVDHPPLVAWTIALFDHGARSVWRVRLGFLLCGAAAAWFAFDLVRRATASSARGWLAAMLVTVAPMAAIGFGLATPDGPYLLGWLASLWCGYRACTEDRMGWWIAVGVAVGMTTLARIFGLGLGLGFLVFAVILVRRRTVGVAGPIVAAVLALACMSPIAIWNVQHHAEQLRFSLEERQQWHAFEPITGLRTFVLAGLLCAGFSAPWIIAGALRERRQPSLLAQIAFASAAPLLALLVVLSFFEPCEPYWFAGPVFSLIVAGSAVASPRALVWSALPSALLAIVASLFALTPSGGIIAFAHRVAPALASPSVLEIYSYGGLARDLAQRYPGEPVVTDGYGLSSLLDFHRENPPMVIGYNTEGLEAEKWLHPRNGSILYLDPVAMSQRPDLVARLVQACGTIQFLPPVTLREDGTLLHRFSVTRCARFDARSVAILNRR
jgi:4-amino-4-deoxy-L-arabinose transferase-like glycosyltransferase